MSKIVSPFLLLLSIVSAHALNFNVTYDSSVTSLTNAAQVEAAFAVATHAFQSLYTNNTTVNLTVYFSTNVDLGESSFALVGNPSYAQLTNALSSARKTTADSNSVASLPASNPIGTNVWWVPRAQAKALNGFLGVSPDDPSQDGSVYFASTVSYAFDPTNRAVSGRYDFIAVAEHEISEVLGRGFALNYSGLAGSYLPYDLFRFTGSGMHSLNVNDSNVYFSVDDGATPLKYFYPNVNSGDVQDWQNSSPADAYDAYLYSGDEATLSAADLTALDILGYDLNFSPLRLKDTRLANGDFQLTFTNVTGLDFSILASTNLTLSTTNWTNLGAPIETAAGQYEFTDTATKQARFYRVRLN